MTTATCHHRLAAAAAALLFASTSFAGEITADLGRRDLQAQLVSLLPDTRARAAAVGREIADRALAGPTMQSANGPLPQCIDVAAVIGTRDERS